MNRHQAMNYSALLNTVKAHGLTMAELDTLLRCERALSRWAERECGDGSDWAIERDEVTGRPFNVYHGEGDSRRYPIADREAGALKRAQKIAEAHGLKVFHQGDCRGCMLYLLRPGDVPEGAAVESYYTRGLAVCY